MRRLILGLLMCLPASAAGTTAVLFRYGAWAVCSSPARVLVDPKQCEGLVAGTEQYLLNLHTELQSTTRYEYTVVAIVEGIEAPVTLTGTIQRADNVDGYTNASVCFGGVVVSYRISVKNLGVVGETVDILGSFK